MTVEKVIIPAAGLGTRLLTVSKELPKEMLPLFALNNKGELCIKPLFELIMNSRLQAHLPKLNLHLGFY